MALRKRAWEFYYASHRRYQLAMSQSRLSTLLADYVLKDFPKRLPHEIGRQFGIFMARMGSLVESRVAEKSKEIREVPFDSFEIAVLLFRMDTLGLQESMSKSRTPVVEVGNSLRSQELVMLFAYLDSFLSDTLKAICMARPEILKKDKTLRWDEITSAGGWDPLITMMIEKYGYDFGRESLPRRLGLLDQLLKFPKRVRESFAQLRQTEKLRHLIVHNGGKVDYEYIQENGGTKLTLGDVIPISDAYVAGSYVNIKLFCNEIFVWVGKKVFNKKEAEFSQLLRMKAPSNLP